ncbi:MAG: MFS transporter [Planctomycetota bacterium]|nr:MAG: MFS transporter [Planctomycetota bacterium]
MSGKATEIRLLDFRSPPMRAFHMSWVAFFLCFFAWFGLAPLMPIVRREMGLTPQQVGWCIIGSVAITVLARLGIGRLCDRFGPRRTYSVLLVLGAVPVMAVGLSWNFTSFLICRVLIGAIGASFVITQYHTSLMFASNCVGTANATTAGWGNLGGGVTQLFMPLIFAALVGTCGLSESAAWRVAMLLAGAACAVTGVAYYLLTQDTPEGDLDASGRHEAEAGPSFWSVVRAPRVLALFVVYGACFGIELTINNVAALYFVDYFPEFEAMEATAAVKTAGMLAALFGLMNLFARTLGGWISDRLARRWGLPARVWWLFAALFGEGLALMLFSQMGVLWAAVVVLLGFSLFVQMSEGATFAVVPFVDRRALGTVSGIVGAGGNAGAVAAGFLFRGDLSWPTALFVLGMLVTAASFLALTVSLDRLTAGAADGTNAHMEAAGAAA